MPFQAFKTACLLFRPSSRFSWSSHPETDLKREVIKIFSSLQRKRQIFQAEGGHCDNIGKWNRTFKMRVFHGNAPWIACRVHLHTWPSVNVLQGRLYHRLMRTSMMRTILNVCGKMTQGTNVTIFIVVKCYRIIWPLCARSNDPDQKRNAEIFK